MEEVIATVEQGKLKGKIEKDEFGNPFYSFHGIPYAKPPIGPLRFKAPEPAEPWTGIRDATKEGQMCYASHFSLDVQQNICTGSEDCLFLNVFTHYLSENGNNQLKPVMVFMYGGGFVTGSSDRFLYGPELLMTEDIVLVTFNYRVGALGFLSIEDPAIGSIGNAGMKDMVEMLKWIQKNIKQFGGDPNNVTLFGQSAGSAAIHYLVLSPMTKGLFHKAILQSGTVLNSWTRGDKDNAEKLAKILGCNKTTKKNIFEFLQNINVEQLHSGQEKLGDHLDASLPNRYFAPTVDKTFLLDEPFKLLKTGNYNHIPMIMGYMSRESYALNFYKALVPTMDIRCGNPKCFVPYFMNLEKDSDSYDEISNKIIQFYFKSNEVNLEDDAFYQLSSDNDYIREINTSVKLHAKTSTKPLYYFRFSADSKLNVVKMILNMNKPGAAHGDELGYLFKSIISPSIIPDTTEHKLCRQLIRMWVNFATYGNPTAVDNDELLKVKWEPVKPDEIHYLDIGNELVLDKNPEHERIQFWGQIHSYGK